jgi:hypothetical protein
MKMALLRSVNNVPNIDYYEYRETNFYNKYSYRAKLTIDGLSYTRYARTPQDLLNRLTGPSRTKIREHTLNQVMAKITELNNYINWRNTHKKSKAVTCRLEMNSVSIYSDDLDLLLTLKDLGVVTVNITEAQLEKFSGTKYYVNKPKHNYRIYLRGVYFDDKNFVKDLYNTIEKSKELVPSKALKEWLDKYINRPHLSVTSWKYSRTDGNHSIDYDNESTLSYLLLMYGHMLGKRYKLEKRPEPV